MIDDIVLDHVAVAVQERRSTWGRYGHDLPPARYLGGGVGFGFANYQVEYPGLRLEVLRPARVDENDFLRRFLDRSGPGPHHLKFKVGDIAGAIGAAERAGYRPVGIDLSDPTWKEAFLHPRDIPGVVVQLAWTSNQWEDDYPDGWPERRTVKPGHPPAPPPAGTAPGGVALGGCPPSCPRTRRRGPTSSGSSGSNRWTPTPLPSRRAIR